MAGLLRLPLPWTPSLIALPSELYDLWHSDQTKLSPEDVARLAPKLAQALKKISRNFTIPLIIRSSATDETMDDRGLYKSIVVQAPAELPSVLEAVQKIFLQFKEKYSPGKIAIAIQPYLKPISWGHLSNEVHLTPTRNQWKYQVEGPTLTNTRGVNSRRESPPSTKASLGVKSGLDISRVLRKIGRWLNREVHERSHIEWCLSSNRLWIVQLDVESPTSAGEDPNVPIDEVRRQSPIASKSEINDVFKLYKVGEETQWKKLENINDFVTNPSAPTPKLYHATAESLAFALSQEGGRSRIAAYVNELTNGRAVLRTDTVSADLDRLNLPRTHTVDGEAAAKWIEERLTEFTEKALRQQDICFILHQYIPAQAAAWSYYAPHDSYVNVDSLWGLPDGLQFLPHDSFQLNPKTGRVVSQKVRYKPQFLKEQADGSWEYMRVARQFGRSQSLPATTLKHIARETVAIADKIGDHAQIMWFCEIPASLELGRHLPWYRSREDFQNPNAVPRPPWRIENITSVEDLERLESSNSQKLVLRIAPNAELLRADDKFLDRAIEVARARSLPVELAGSVLGHAYYKLQKSGILVVSAEPYSAYYRVRGRKAFHKLVRDDIPGNIASKGEQVVQAKLPKSQTDRALVAKLFEEAMEFLGAQPGRERTEELADLLEVVRGLANAEKIAWGVVEKTANTKRAARGGFSKQTVLVETSFPKPDDKGSRKKTELRGQMPLERMGRLSVRRGSIRVPFERLISATDEVSAIVPIENDAVRVKAKIDGPGIVLTIEKAGDEQPSLQLPFDLLPSARGKGGSKVNKPRRKPSR